jgi:hypothetical protein
MTTLDNPITFAEVNQAINKLKKEKHQDSMAFPWKRSKQWTPSHDVQSIDTYVTSSKA